MRVLVCGGRDFTDFKMMERILDVLPITSAIEGGARGADTGYKQYAERRGIPVSSFPAQWDKHGRSAGPIRNKQMLDEGRPELVIAFPGGKGTRNMIDQAIKAGIEVKIIEI